MNIFKKHARIFTIILTAAIAISLLEAVGGIGFGEAGSTNSRARSEDRKVAEDISNITGASVDKILSLRNEGRSWNEVLNVLKYRREDRSANGSRERENLLSGFRADGDFIKRLEDEGFSDEEITEAKLLAERVEFQLREIISDEVPGAELPELEIAAGSHISADEDVYRELAEKFDIETCMYLVLKLREEFGSAEAVMDEYLFSLQIGIDMSLYLADKDAYWKQRAEKSAGMSPQNTITLFRLEEKLLNNIRYANRESSISGKSGASPVAANGSDAAGNPLPEVSVPKVQDIVPENPADALMKEIEAINPMAD